MRRLILPFLIALPLLAAGPKPKVRFTTSLGAFTVQLEPEAAPKTVENFLGYVRSGHFKGTVFHRVIKDFMVQGGGFTEDLKRKDTRSSIDHEGERAKKAGLGNRRGTVAMALPEGNPFGATAQFFVNVKDNPHLDFKAKGMTTMGYCVFGKVVAGMDTIDKIRNVKTSVQKGMKDVPVNPVQITDAKEI
jgi:cyclophilin family peptidyl-prolyl cis-trans isomerase